MSDLASKARQLRPSLLGTVALSAFPVLVVVGFALLAQLVLNPFLAANGMDFWAKLSVDAGVAIVLAVSLTMINGFTGQFSIGHAAFMAVGAYTAASIVYYGSFRIWGSADMQGGLVSSMISMTDRLNDTPKPLLTTGGDVLFAVAAVAGGLAAALCGYLVGLPSLRLKGDYLAIVTLGFGEIVRTIIVSQTTSVLSDADEIAKTPWYKLAPAVGSGLGFSGLPFYNSLFWSVLAAGLTLVVAYRLKTSTYGRAFLSIREDEIAAEAMGVNTTRFKVRAFVVSAFFAGVAGALFAHTVGVQLNPGELGFQKSFDIIIMVVLGGLGSISGAAIAAVILTALPEALRNPGDIVTWWHASLGVVITGVVLSVVLAATGRARTLGTGILVIGLLALGLCGLAEVSIAGLPLLHIEAGAFQLTDYRMVLFALALISMMILRPQGLFGVRELWEPALWRDTFRSASQARKTGGKA